MPRLSRALRAVALAASLTAAPGLAPNAFAQEAGAQAAKQYIPLATYRVGAYASSGTPVWGGTIDYLRYLNEVEGGINGVKLTWEECETEWAVEKGV
ncbi:hypothetical protein AFFFEF_02915 [Methylorubrum extorquens]